MLSNQGIQLITNESERHDENGIERSAKRFGLVKPGIGFISASIRFVQSFLLLPFCHQPHLCCIVCLSPTRWLLISPVSSRWSRQRARYDGIPFVSAPLTSIDDDDDGGGIGYQQIYSPGP
jgi:hypothetical protein